MRPGRTGILSRMCSKRWTISASAISSLVSSGTAYASSRYVSGDFAEGSCDRSLRTLHGGIERPRGGADAAAGGAGVLPTALGGSGVLRPVPGFPLFFPFAGRGAAAGPAAPLDVSAASSGAFRTTYRKRAVGSIAR